MNKKHITVIAKVTSACNLNCPYCYTRSTIKNGSYMPIETFEKLVLNASMFYDSASIIFHGGEPTLMSLEWYKQAFKILDDYSEMYDIKFDYGIQTNLTNYDEEKFKLFEEKGVSIGFSYDGLTNEKTRGNDEVILTNFSKIKHHSKHNNAPGCITLVTANNYKELSREQEYFKILDLNSKLNIVFNTETMVGETNRVNYSDILVEYKKIIDEIFISDKHPFQSTFYEHFTYLINGVKGLCSRIDCRKKWISVHPDGNCYPCGQEWRQKNDNYYLGNINDSYTFADAFECDKFKTFSKKIDKKNKECEECEIFDFCNGGCPGESFSNNGDVDKKHEETCKFDINVLRYIKEKLTDDVNIKNNLILMLKEKEKEKERIENDARKFSKN